jgi:hypothetical protein
VLGDANSVYDPNFLDMYGEKKRGGAVTAARFLGSSLRRNVWTANKSDIGTFDSAIEISLVERKGLAAALMLVSKQATRIFGV